MSEVLVLVDHVDGEVKKVTYELLTAARALGEPSAVVVGAPGSAAKAKESLASYGAAKVYVAESDDADSYLVTPKVDALAARRPRRRLRAEPRAGRGGAPRPRRRPAAGRPSRPRRRRPVRLRERQLIEQ